MQDNELLLLLTSRRIAATTDAIVRLKGGASGKQFYRIVPCGERASAIVVGFTDVEAFDLYVRNSDFYAGRSISVPGILFSLRDRSTLVLEDCGPCTLQETGAEMSDSLLNSTYRSAVQLLVNLQRTPFNATWSPPYFDLRKYQFETENHIIAKLIEFYFEYNLSRSEGILIRQSMNTIAETLLKTTMVFAHRDFQSSNLVLHEGKLVVTDFQDSLFAHPLYDLVSLLEDSYVKLSDKLKSDLLDYYFAICDAQIARMRDLLEYQYGLLCIQRKLHDAGAFAAAFQTFGKSSFLKYIDGSLRNALSAMNAYPDLHTLHSLLKKMVRRHEQKNTSSHHTMDLL